MHFAASCSKPASLYTHGNTIVMQPFQCDLQPRIQETQRTTHTGTTIRCRTQRRNPLRSERPQPHPPHTGSIFRRWLHNHLFTRKNTRFRAPASSPTQAPCNIHSAITMHFATSCSKPASLYAHGNTKWQSCSHSNAICNRRFKKCKELRTQEQPLVAEHRGGTWRNPVRSERPQPHPPHTGGTCHRWPQPLYTKKCKVSCSGFLPNTSPMQHSFSHYHAFCSIM